MKMFEKVVKALNKYKSGQKDKKIIFIALALGIGSRVI